MKKAIIFDFDGVIVDTFNFSYGIYKQVQPTLTEEQFRSWFNGNIYDKLDQDEKQNIPQVSDEDFWPAYVASIENQAPNSYLAAAIKKFSQQYKLFIVSSTETEVIKTYLDKFLPGIFIKIYGADIEKSKVKKIQMLCAEYELSPDECIFVTDTTGDIVEGRKAGVKSIAVSWGFHSAVSLASESPLAIVDRPESLYKTVEDVTI